MKDMMRKEITAVVIIALLAGCSVVDKRKEAYKDAELLQPLEVPPDLLSIDASDDLSAAVAPIDGSVTLSEFNKAQAEATQPQVAAAKAAPQGAPAVHVGLPLASEDVTVARDGNDYWIIVPGQPEAWWGHIKNFWQNREVGMEKENPALGLMQTEWIEDKSKVPVSSIFDKAFSALRSTNLRDQYVVRMEPALSGNATEIHLIHRGMQHVAVDDQLRWLPRERDVELEIETLKKLALYIGLGEDKTEQLLAKSEELVEKALVEKAEDDTVRLKLAMGFEQAWREVGDQMLANKMELEDFNRSTGVYYVRGNLLQKIDKADVFASFLNEKKGEVKPFLVKLQESDGLIYVTVEGREGAEVTMEESENFLTVLKENLD
jgi:outer membrane protein assembly factor BamC